MPISNLDKVHSKLNEFIHKREVPNILFHGAHNTDKEEIVFSFLDKIYSNIPDYRRNYVMYVNCAYGTGIKFIRDNIKFFAKMHNYPNSDFNFKTIVLCNAEYLTPDAQSAMRRCIEEFSKTTRFIFTTSDKQKILMPILSRFCEIFVYDESNLSNKIINPSNKIPSILKGLKTKNIYDRVDKCINLSISGLELYNYICNLDIPIKQRLIYQGLMMHYMKIIHNEKMIIFTILESYLNINRLDIKNKPFV